MREWTNFVISHTVDLLFVLAFACLIAAEVSAQEVRPGTSGYLDVLMDHDKTAAEENLKFAWSQDPFLKTPGYVKAKRKPVSFDLKAIVYSDDDKSVAIVNNSTVFENSLIEGHKVQEIGPNYVVLAKDENLVELQLPVVDRKIASEVEFWNNAPAVEETENAKGEDEP